MAARGIRGAIQVSANTPEAISGSALELVGCMADENGVKPADVVFVCFSVTPDLNADFPARAVRTRLKGWGFVPLLCTQEVAVPGAMERLLRVLMVVNSRRSQSGMRHQYVGAAARLRPDREGARCS